MYRPALPFVFLLLFLLAADLAAQGPPCRPCAGVRVDDVAALTGALATPPVLEDEARLYAVWEAELDGGADAGVFDAVRAAGGTPWAVLRLRTPSPLTANVEALEAELREVARLARGAGERAHFQIEWAGAGAADARELAFLIKRAAVAITGAHPEARVIAGPLRADGERLRALYGEEIAAYVDGIALAPASPTELAAAIAVLGELDPGKPVTVDALPFPDDPRAVLPLAAEQAERGVAITLFRRSRPSAEELLPLKLLAREFQGDLSLDPTSGPSGARRAWSFVRGSDLGLRVIAEVDPAASTELIFEDPQLRSPELIDPSSGDESPAFGQRRTASRALAVPVEGTPVALLRLERMTAAELEGIEEEVLVADERQLPVEEILRRLQAFEDAQARRLETYRALNTTHMRFQFGTGQASFETTFEGPFFYRQGVGFDWVWQTFYVNGVRWRGKKIPQIPLIEPQKVASLPLVISFTPDYEYRLRGTGTLRGRDCWLVDFSPRAAVDPGGGDYFQGTVWVDRELYARVRTRGLQVGLEGEVLSNEETVDYSPVNADGSPGEWRPENYWLPLRVQNQQLLSLLESTVVVDKETLLTAVELNPENFEDGRQAALASDDTMVRDTAEGLRYLVRDKETGKRRVQKKLEPTRLFVVGGVFYDESFDFPLPLAGINYFSLDFRETGAQANLFFAGALLTADLASPNFLGSRFTASADVFALAVAGSDTLFRNGVEVIAEEVESRPASLDLGLGRPFGSYGKIDLSYELTRLDFSRGDDTDPDFVLPSDHFVHTLGAVARYNRAGYRFQAGGSYNRRSTWEPWGLPGTTDFLPEHEDYLLWRVGAGRTWWLPNFQKLSAEVEYLGGEDLDRFSKYQFGFFSDVRVHGYQSDRVRAEEALATHLSYGINIAEVFRIELVGDAAWATDELSGLSDELLAGVGLVGTFIGPWQTIINVDLGAAVAGPDDGFVLFLAFLKLLK